MTLALAIKCSDAIIMAADSRGTIGDPRGLTAVNDTQQKLFQFGSCALALAGSAETALALIDEFGKRNLAAPTNVDDAVAAFGQAAAWCDGWYGSIPPQQRPETLFLLGGYRTGSGSSGPTPMVYLLASSTRFAPQLVGPYPMMIGVPQYAVYLSHRYYDPKLTADRATALAEYMISETASQDPKVGGPVRIAKLTPQGYSELTRAEVDAVASANQKLNADLKKFFVQVVS